MPASTVLPTRILSTQFATLSVSWARATVTSTSEQTEPAGSWRSSSSTMTASRWRSTP